MKNNDLTDKLNELNSNLFELIADTKVSGCVIKAYRVGKVVNFSVSLNDNTLQDTTYKLPKAFPKKQVELRQFARQPSGNQMCMCVIDTNGLITVRSLENSGIMIGASFSGCYEIA